ncbi:MAG TPA: biopolymer transporter ExbD [Salinisphaeraceae bacterium]|nr:biopolymer transporter ExbD [Salinisphaeraceae bacterium]
MRIARRQPEEPPINLTPLIDVVFLLLIFFMVSTQFVAESSLSLALPQAASAEQDAAPAFLEVVVDAKNQYHIADEPIAAADLAAAMAAWQQRHAEHVLLLRADRKATHGAVVRVLDAAASREFTTVDIAVLEEGS